MNGIRLGSFVDSDDFGGVVIAMQGDRALVCENHFAGVMITGFGATVESIRENMECRWIKLAELTLDEDEDD